MGLNLQWLLKDTQSLVKVCVETLELCLSLFPQVTRRERNSSIFVIKFGTPTTVLRISHMIFLNYVIV